MSRSWLVTFIVMIMLLAIAGAVLLSRTEPLVLSEADAGKTVELKVGEEFAVTLMGNPTTGYNWEMVVNEGAIVEQVGEPEFKSVSDLLGAGGRISLNFKATNPGRQALQLIYHRSWEENVAPLNTFTVNLIIEE